MRNFNSAILKIFNVAIVVLICSVNVQAQSANSILSDTVSSENAALRRTQTSAVNFDVNKLNSIVATCLSRGITSVQFIFAKIRVQDTATYFLKHSGIPQVYHGSMVNKPTILIKVPRSAFNLALNENPQNNDLVQKMKGGGLPLISESFGGVMFADGYLYFDAGAVCPPPDGCSLN